MRLIPTIIATSAVLALSGCASIKQLQNTNAEVESLRMDMTTLKARVHRLENQPKPSADARSHRQRYCYLNGQRYTEGAVVSGRICEKSFATNVADPELEWRYHSN